MTDVLLLLPPVSFSNPGANSGIDIFPLGLGYLQSALTNAGISTRAINNSAAYYSINDLLDLCEAERVRILGLSCMTPTVRSAVMIARAAKERFSDRLHILAGNYHIGADPGLLTRYPYFDSALIGEADNAIVDHCRALLCGEKKHGVFQAQAPVDLDTLPFPALDAIELTEHHPHDTVPMLGTRGCPFHCGYCSVPRLSNRFRHRSPDNVYQEMISRLPLGRRFYFNDDCATINHEYISGLCTQIMNGKQRISFQLITRIDTVTDDMCILLKKAGCNGLLVGIESGNERIRNEIIRKNLTDEVIFSRLEITCRHNLPVLLFFTIGHPEETADNIQQTIEYPLLLEKNGFTNIIEIGYHLTFPIPGTRYFDWSIEHGGIPPTIIDDYIEGRLGDGFFGHWPYLVPHGLTTEQMRSFQKEGHRKFFLRPRFVMRKFLHDLAHPHMLLGDAKNAFYVIRQGTSQDISKTDT